MDFGSLSSIFKAKGWLLVPRSPAWELETLFLLGWGERVVGWRQGNRRQKWDIPQVTGQEGGHLWFSFACTIKWKLGHPYPSPRYANSSIPSHPFDLTLSTPSHPLDSITFDGHLLCARQCSGCWRDRTDTVPAFNTAHVSINDRW